MSLPGKRLDGGTTSARALGLVGDPGSEKSFEAKQRRRIGTLQSRRASPRLQTGGIFVEEEFMVFLVPIE